MKLTINTKILGIMLAITATISGCTNSETLLRSGKSIPELDHNAIDYSRLYWCIDEINRRHIYRGMTRHNLTEVMGKFLVFSEDGKTARSTLSFTTDPTYQAPPPWEIRFKLDEAGVVEDYGIDLRGPGK